jgi:hypothetical protein
MDFSAATLTTAGVLLVTIAAVEYGGVFMLGILRDKATYTDYQRSSFRAGHAHAGVLVILSLIALVYADALALDGIAGFVSRSAIPMAAILMPAGFFFSAAGGGRTAPNRFIALVYLGAAVLGIGVITLGVGLLAA